MDTREDIIRYLIAGVVEREGPLGKTKLVKLLYLLDVDAYSRYRKRPTGFEWRYYFFGPYDGAIEEVLDRLDLEVPEEEVTTRAGARALVFRPESVESLFERARLGDRVRRAADRILDRWALADLYAVLDEVYFRTPPMANARPGDVLDFTIIPSYGPDRGKGPLPPVERAALTQIRKGMIASKSHAAELIGLARDQQARLFSTEDPDFSRFMLAFADREERQLALDGAVIRSLAWSEDED